MLYPGWISKNGWQRAAAGFHVPHDLHAAQTQERHEQRRHPEAEWDPETNQASAIFLPEAEEDADGQSLPPALVFYPTSITLYYINMKYQLYFTNYLFHKYNTVDYVVKIRVSAFKFFSLLQ